MDIKDAEDILLICLMALSGGILLLPFMEKDRHKGFDDCPSVEDYESDDTYQRYNYG